MTTGVDVAVIGGGIAGMATAAFLAQAGARVRLYERAEIGAGASGRNSGVVQHPFDPVLADLYRRSLAEYRDLEIALDGAFALPREPAGLLFVGHDRQVAESEAVQWASAWPETAPEVLDGRALASLEPSLAPDVVACRLRMGHPVAPAAATEAFAELARRAGAEIVLGQAASLVVDRDRVVGVQGDGHVTGADAVVVAAGPWTPTVVDPKAAWRPIVSIWGVVASVVLQNPPHHGLELIEIDVEPGNIGDGATADGRPPEPLTPSDDLVEFSLAPASGSSALGSTFVASEPDGATWVDSLRRVGARYVPEIATAPITGVRQCARPVSRDGRPLVGRAGWADGLWIHAGHGPWGISTGPGSARLLANALLGHGEAIPDSLGADRFGTPGQPAGQRQELGSVR